VTVEDIDIIQNYTESYKIGHDEKKARIYELGSAV
jgi:hypothetical protein